MKNSSTISFSFYSIKNSAIQINANSGRENQVNCVHYVVMHTENYINEFEYLFKRAEIFDIFALDGVGKFAVVFGRTREREREGLI